MGNPITEIVKEEFKKNEVIILQDLYITVEKTLAQKSNNKTSSRYHLAEKMDEKKRNHGVRSAIDQMLRSNKIKRISPSRYIKIE